MKVTVDNLQKITHGEFEFPVGLTIICGRNGSGKTALFRGIDGLLTNKSGTAGYIQHGKPDCRVTIENNGNSVTWVRKKASSEYIDNNTGKSYPKASKLDSRDIADLGFYFDRKGKVVNIHDEWSVLFPFGESESEMFKLFEDIFGISCSATVVDELKKDESVCKTDIARINEEYDRNKLTIENIDKEYALIEVDKCLDLGKNIKCLNELAEEIEKHLPEYASSKEVSKRVVPNVQAIDDLTLIVQKFSKKCEDIEADLVLYKNSLSCYNINIPELNQTLFSFKDVDIPLAEYKSLKSDVERHTNTVQHLVVQEQELKAELSKIKVCPTCGRPIEE